jgi:hypothetical protein
MNGLLMEHLIMIVNRLESNFRNHFIIIVHTHEWTVDGTFHHNSKQT